MSDKNTQTSSAGNAFFDTWLSGQQQMLKMQQQWVAAGNEMLQNSEVVSATEKAEKSWQLCEQSYQDWLNATKRWLKSSPVSQAGDDENIVNNFINMLNPDKFMQSGMSEFSEVLQNLANGPDFADIGVIEKKVLRSSQDWLALRNASAEYQLIISKAWLRAFDSFTQDMSSLKGVDPDKPKEMLNHWLKLANEQLIQVQRSEEFLAAQQELVRSSSQYKLKQREFSELWCESYAIPTRTEVDDLHKTVYLLRREIRELKRQVKATNAVKQKKNSRKKAS